jgi:prephenate dehydrogenase
MKNSAVVIGLGLIGGSLALELKKRFDWHVIGVDLNEVHAQKALDLEIIDEIGDIGSVKKAATVVIAVPVTLQIKMPWCSMWVPRKKTFVKML